ncbi:exonuclease domain-containing protein [Gorillibacterium sp. sgz5001074]|uniref:exonuclease domain-containing protein n=1 Tax=Gorillibacterium sp. sgz5001074 TaxID=3446695 RepID=UPI003F677B79
MNYIVYDLEFTVIRKQEWLAEIIEIGAVKVKDTEGKLQIAETFQTFVKPLRDSSFTAHTTSFTGITLQDIQNAPSLSSAIEAFRQWIGDEPYYMCAWGPDDKYQLVKSCNEHKLPLDWIRNHNDIQKQFSRKHSTETTFRQIGLKRALEMLEIPFEGSHHRAVDDAVNTAKVFIAAFGDLTLAENNAAEESIYTTHTVYETGDNEPNLPLGNLAELLKRSLDDKK